MIENIKNIIRNKKQVYVIDVEISAEGTYQYNAIKLIKEKDVIDFTVIDTGGNDLISLQNKIPKHEPVCLIVCGKGIIYREAMVNASLTDTDIIKLTIPNANPEEFYLQQYLTSAQGEKQNKIIALVRKSVIDKLIDTLSEKFSFIVDISVGPFILDNILPVIPGEHSLHYKNILIRTAEQKISSFEIQPSPTKQTIRFGTKDLDTGLLPAVASGFTYLLYPENNHVPVKNILHNKKECLYKQKTAFTGAVSLAVIFISLIINFFIFDHFYKKIQTEQPEVEQQAEMINKLKQLNETFTAKNKFLKQTGLLNHDNNFSFYLDRIAETIPGNVILSDLEINPLLNRLKKETYEFNKNLIRVSGISTSSTDFNNWIKILKNNPLFQNVSIINYEHKIRENSAFFTVELTFSEI